MESWLWGALFFSFFDQVETLIDLSLPLTDEAVGGGVGGEGWGGLQPGLGQTSGSRRGHLSLVVAEQSAETQSANVALTSVRQRKSQEVWRL